VLWQRCLYPLWKQDATLVALSKNIEGLVARNVSMQAAAVILL
jgi:hypothetical protein